MDICYTGWTWIKSKDKDLAKSMLEDSFRELKYIGYDHTENFAFITEYFDSPDELIALLNKYEMDLCNLYGHFIFDEEAMIKMAKKQINFLKAIGGRWYNCQHDGYKDGLPLERPINQENIEMIARIANAVGKYAYERGIALTFHPHYGTCVFTREEIDYFASVTDARYVYFCIDTAHTTLAGIEPEKLIKDLNTRIKYIHLKDVDTFALRTAEGADKMKTFRELGYGTVDFKAVKNALEEIGYDGMLCVELDRPKIGNYHAAETSRKYIKDVLDL